MFPLNVLPKRHLQKSKAHVQGFYDVRLSSQGMLAAGTLPARHLSLDCLEPLQHLILETLKGAVQDVGANLLEPLASQSDFTNFFEGQICKYFFKYFIWKV